MGKTTENPRYHVVTTRVDDRTYGMLLRAAAKTGTSPAKLTSSALASYLEEFKK